MAVYPFTTKHHNDTYPSIDPTLPAHSATGKSILVTGGSSGIGKATAQAFAAAGAKRLIIVSRSTANLEETKAEINKTFPATKVETYSTDITVRESVDKTFDSAREGGEINVCVLSAAFSAPFAPPLSMKREDMEKSTEINFYGNMNIVQAYLSTGDPDKKTIINISTGAAHLVFPPLATYASTKLLWTYFLQHIYEEQKANGLKVFQIHPGTVYTDLAKSVGVTEDSREWDKAVLPANFTVWLASPEASFLNGKFVWAAWDVDELKARQEEIKENPALLTIGLQVK